MTTQASTTPSTEFAPVQARATASSAAWLGAASLALALLAIAWFFAVLVRDVEAADFTRLDTSAARFDAGPGWVDPRWEAQIAQQLAPLTDLDVDSSAAREQVQAALAALPFIAEVGTPRVLWPDGLRVDVRLRNPVACARLGDTFVTLCADRFVLPGAWSTPPPREHGYLPVLACDEVGRGEIAEGARVSSAALIDGLAVALALDERLAADDWVRLGRIVIDARRARVASVEEPGTVFWLAGGRRIEFGRAPNLDAPGELPLEQKCASIASALRTLDAGPLHFDWELADVRWDRPELLPRGGLDRDAPRRRSSR